MPSTPFSAQIREGSHKSEGGTLITLASGTSVLMTYGSTYLDGYATSATRENGDTIDYQYDGVGRLMDEWRKTSGGTPPHPNPLPTGRGGKRLSHGGQRFSTSPPRESGCFTSAAIRGRQSGMAVVSPAVLPESFQAR